MSTPPTKHDAPRLIVGSAERILREAATAHAENRLQLAEELLRQLIEHQPRNAPAWHLRGLNAARGGEMKAALQFLGRAVALDSANARQRADLAILLQRLGEHDSACRQFERAREDGELGPTDFFHYANALLARGDAAAAVPAYRAARAGRPDDPEILNNLGLALSAAGQAQAAAECLEAALRHRPDWADALLNLGNVLRTGGQPDAAAECYRRAITQRPRDFRIYGSLGLALLDLGRAEDAIAVYEKALAIEPDEPMLRTSLGIAQLLLGDLSEGWANYESRWRTAEAAALIDRLAAIPEWSGEPLAGRSILLHAEQGFGDTLQFCRYVPLIAASAEHAVFECPRPLVRLMGSLADGVEIVARGESHRAIDFRAGLLSLPRLTGAGGHSFDTIPRQTPYLTAPPSLARAWRVRLSGAAGLKVGLVWAGNPKRQDDRMRSCPAEALRPLLDLPGLRWFGLQKELPEDAGASAALAAKMTDLGPELDDFADTAAAMAALDLIVSVDTAAAHLAGALGRPVWTLLGFAADWRYRHTGNDMPWYPTMRLYRQSARGDWGSLVTRVAADLSAIANADGQPFRP